MVPRSTASAASGPGPAAARPRYQPSANVPCRHLRTVVGQDMAIEHESDAAGVQRGIREVSAPCAVHHDVDVRSRARREARQVSGRLQSQTPRSNRHRRAGIDHSRRRLRQPEHCFRAPRRRNPRLPHADRPLPCLRGSKPASGQPRVPPIRSSWPGPLTCPPRRSLPGAPAPRAYPLRRLAPSPSAKQPMAGCRRWRRIQTNSCPLRRRDQARRRSARRAAEHCATRR